MSSLNEKFSQLISHLLKLVPKIKAVAIVDRGGLIIASQLRDDNTQDDVIGATTALFDTFLDRIKKDFGSAEEFLTIMTVEQNKLLFAGAGSEAILTIFAEKDAIDSKLKVFGNHIAGKIKLILENEDVDLEIPPIIKILSNIRSGRLPVGDYSSKVIIVGNPQVGKTSLLRRFVEQKFVDNYISTIGVDISRETIKLNKKCKIGLALWDIGGQIRNTNLLRKRFYQGANQVIIQFDISRKKTFLSIDRWIDDLKDGIQHNFDIVLIANKMDLKDHEITIEDIEKKADELKCQYILTSAKTGSNVKDVFHFLAYKYIENL